MRFDRTNKSLLSRWWWTIDRSLLVSVVLLLCVGAIVVTASSPPVAKRLDLNDFYFVKRHYVFLVLGLAMVVGMSVLQARTIKRLSFAGLFVSLLLMVVAIMAGPEIKGATRWIAFGGFSLQPSELAKPFLVVVVASLCAEQYKQVNFPGKMLASGAYALVATLLIVQPDFGMLALVSATWGVQLFLAGLSLFIIGLLAVGGIGVFVVAYFTVSHVRKRIDTFLDPGSGDNYQVGKSLEALQSGGLLGRGPGEGKVKHSLPDSHTDFVFSVAGEEFGVLGCLFILIIFAFIAYKMLRKMWQSKDLFTILALGGLVTQFALQAIINMGVAVKLLPAKGMTLPFISYGGSSVLSVAIAIGFALALTRKRYGR